MEHNITHNRMGNFLFRHLEESLGTIAGVLAYFHLDALLTIPIFTDAVMELTFKFVVAVVCGVGGGLGGLVVKAVLTVVKTYRKDKLEKELKG